MIIIESNDSDLEFDSFDGGYNPIFRYKGELFTGMIQYRNEEEGWLEFEEEYDRGILKGKYRSYFAEGTLREECDHYLGGSVFDGRYRMYFNDGKIQKDLIYNMGKILSAKVYDENGRTVKDFAGSNS